MDMDANDPITIRRAGRDDVVAIIAMLADDHLGRARERLEEPLPKLYFDAFERVERDPNIELMVAEEAGRVVGCLQLCILPGLSSQGASRGLIDICLAHRFIPTGRMPQLCLKKWPRPVRLRPNNRIPHSSLANIRRWSS